VRAAGSRSPAGKRFWLRAVDQDLTSVLAWLPPPASLPCVPSPVPAPRWAPSSFESEPCVLGEAGV
jgi:hypothetical protein